MTYKPKEQPIYFDKNLSYVTFFNGESWDIYE